MVAKYAYTGSLKAVFGCTPKPKFHIFSNGLKGPFRAFSACKD